MTAERTSAQVIHVHTTSNKHRLPSHVTCNTTFPYYQNIKPVKSDEYRANILEPSRGSLPPVIVLYHHLSGLQGLNGILSSSRITFGRLFSVKYLRVLMYGLLFWAWLNSDGLIDFAKQLFAYVQSYQHTFVIMSHVEKGMYIQSHPSPKNSMAANQSCFGLPQ